jgi:hypothetical protein
MTTMINRIDRITRINLLVIQILEQLVPEIRNAAEEKYKRRREAHFCLPHFICPLNLPWQRGQRGDVKTKISGQVDLSITFL